MTITRSVQFKGRPMVHAARVQPMPPVRQQAANAAGALGRVVAAAVAGKPLTRTEEERNAIQATHCAPCKHYDGARKRCTLCGCWVRWKTRLATEHCPIGLW